MSGEGNHGELRGAVRTSEGIRNNAIEFPTHFDGAYIPGSPSLIVTNDGDGFTVSFWAYPIQWNFEGTTENRVVYRHLQYNVDLWNGGGQFHVFQNGAWPGINDAPEMPLGEWTLVTATWTSDEACKLYGNGSEIAAAPSTAGEIEEHDEWTALGFFSPQQAYVGRLDDLRIYNRRLDDSEIAELLQPTSVSPEGLLTAMWGTLKHGR